MNRYVGGLGPRIGCFNARAFAVYKEAEEKTESLGKVHSATGGNKARLSGGLC
jgi:hypothetical protein